MRWSLTGAAGLSEEDDVDIHASQRGTRRESAIISAMLIAKFAATASCGLVSLPGFSCGGEVD